MSILALPAEILTQVLSYLHPTDILHIGQTCHAIQEIIRSSNSFLWHAAFLQVFDDPRHAWSSTPHIRNTRPVGYHQQVDYWFERLRTRWITLRSIRSEYKGPTELRGLSAEKVIETLLDIVDSAKAGPTPDEIRCGITPQVDDRRSLNLGLLQVPREARLENLIHDCHVVGEDGLDPNRPHTRAMSLSRKRGPRSAAASRLHVLYGRTIRERIESGAKGAARRIVYDWRNPIAANEYGPFSPDGSGEVDWKVLEATASLMLRHFEMGAAGSVIIPPGFCYSIPYRTLSDPTVPEDWARVTGSWVGTYSFLDYPDLFAFNTEDPESDLDDVNETHGDLMILTLRLDAGVKDDPKYRSRMKVSDDLPTLYFSGSSRAFDPYMQPRIDISVKGSVSLCTSRREVRWRYIISYRGHEQWQLEGVQPGGVRAGPVYGLWTQWGHDEHAPVGAFMYVPEELCKKQELVLVS